MKSCQTKLACILFVEHYHPQRNCNCCCSLCKMPTAVALDDPERLKLKDSMETGFNPMGTRPTRAHTHIRKGGHTCLHSQAQ